MTGQKMLALGQISGSELLPGNKKGHYARNAQAQAGSPLKAEQDDTSTSTGLTRDGLFGHLTLLRRPCCVAEFFFVRGWIEFDLLLRRRASKGWVEPWRT